MASLVIRLFGGWEVQIDGRPIPATRTRKGQWLLALLALNQGRAVARERLAAILWPDSADSQSLANLRFSLTNLRHVLGPEARRLLAPTSRSLRLDLTSAVCDLSAFDAAIARGDAASLEESV